MLSRRRYHGRGFTLIEVLVTMLILSIGLMGMAGLQAVSLKMNQSAHLSSQATFWLTTSSTECAPTAAPP